MNTCWTSDEIEKVFRGISTKPFYIFGTGIIGTRFYEALKEKNLLGWFRGFVVSQKKESGFMTEPVFIPDEIMNDNQSTICIAVHESILNEVYESLKSRGLNNTIWIYPYLLELELGPPVKLNLKKNVTALVSGINRINPYAIYYLAIEDIDVGNGIGRDAYLWLYLRGNTVGTAKARLEKLESIIKAFDKEIVLNYPIRINTEENTVADGAHRLMLARYYGLDEIACDIYRFDEKKFVERMKWFFVSDEEIRNTLPAGTAEGIRFVVEKLRNGR